MGARELAQQLGAHIVLPENHSVVPRNQIRQLTIAVALTPGDPMHLAPFNTYVHTYTHMYACTHTNTLKINKSNAPSLHDRANICTHTCT